MIVAVTSTHIIFCFFILVETLFILRLVRKGCEDDFSFIGTTLLGGLLLVVGAFKIFGC